MYEGGIYVRRQTKKFVDWKVHRLKISHDDTISTVGVSFDQWDLSTATPVGHKEVFGHIPWENLGQSMNFSANPCIIKYDEYLKFFMRFILKILYG